MPERWDRRESVPITLLLPRERTPGQLFHKRRVSKMPPILGRSQAETLFKSNFLVITLSFPGRTALKQIRTPVASSFYANKKPAATPS